MYKSSDFKIKAFSKKTTVFADALKNDLLLDIVTIS